MYVLASELMKLNKTRRHLVAELSYFKDKDRAFYQSKYDVCQRRRLDDQGEMYTTSKEAVAASYIVAYCVALMMKSHSIVEELIYPVLRTLYAP